MNKNFSPLQFLQRMSVRREFVFALMLLGALLAFEIFNYSTTDFALSDLLGKELKFMGIRWATILSLAFCGIDFAGIARLFTPEQGKNEPVEVWYLFAAWILAAGMNASLTWWGVAVAINTHVAEGSVIISQTTLTQVIPVFIAVMVWVIRILIIGTFSVAGDRLLSMDGVAPRPVTRTPQREQVQRPSTMRVNNAYSASPNNNNSYPRPKPNPNSNYRPAPKPEASYHPMTARSLRDDEDERQF